MKATLRVALFTVTLYTLVVLEPALFFVQAQRRNGTVAGVVVTSAGRNVVGARVFVQDAGGGKATTDLTNQQGRFFFALLKPGLYNVRAEHNGQWSDWERNVEVRAGHQTEVRLKLNRKPAKKAG